MIENVAEVLTHGVDFLKYFCNKYWNGMNHSVKVLRSLKPRLSTIAYDNNLEKMNQIVLENCPTVIREIAEIHSISYRSTRYILVVVLGFKCIDTKLVLNFFAKNSRRDRLLMWLESSK